MNKQHFEKIFYFFESKKGVSKVNKLDKQTKGIPVENYIVEENFIEKS